MIMNMLKGKMEFWQTGKVGGGERASGRHLARTAFKETVLSFHATISCMLRADSVELSCYHILHAACTVKAHML